LTREECAKKLRVHAKTLRSWEIGSRQPCHKHRDAIARFLRKELPPKASCFHLISRPASTNAIAGQLLAVPSIRPRSLCQFSWRRPDSGDAPV
jgi:hypothetical protein